MRNQKAKPGRPSKADKSLEKLKTAGIFRAKHAKSVGVSQPSLSRWVSENKLVRVGTGMYLHPDSPIEAEERDYAVACAKFGPKAVLGGMTALFHHGMIEQIPHRVWVIVPYERHASDPLYRCLRTKANAKEGIEDHEFYRITNLERTLVEAFRYASKIGLRTAFHATRTALKEKRTTTEKIYRQAKRMKLENFIKRHWEAIISESEAA